ncbi:MAG: UDP-N-acetylmuramoyl-L-alanine--D-glutamate ligase [Fibromonadaceae bacterium]|jgi:UDP-N-acetylmuramoylalanine--D-glutamate ligase|nr:UDP-N-acetylmuramoyl-L-alanine--D-glutamate ligase [Fibromonadaceae bacterium]
MQKLWNEPIGILGFGTEGKSTLKFLQEMGAGNISIFDKSDGVHYLDNLQNCKTIIRSAGVYPLQKEILNAQAKGAELTSQIELFFKIMQCDYPHVQIIGITGTLGKGSCVSMIAHCLEALSAPHKIGGNFGIPALDLLQHKNLLLNKDTVIILELSSFQLMTLKLSPHIGVVLQTTTEHLDWHTSLEQYRDAKANLVRWQKKSDYCIYNKASEGAAQIANQSIGIKKPFSVEGNAIEIEGHSLSISECKITGAHQLQNMAAALLALQSLGFNVKTCMEHLRSYEGLEYRLQKMESKSFKNKKLDFYNDSYSTRPEAAISAAASMSKPFAIILGGSEKHADFTELSQELAKNNLLNSVALIGTTAERLQKSLQSENCKAAMQIFENLPTAFQWCLENTPNNGAILLSPACASFGLFANYKERGEAFNKLLNSLNFMA